MFILELYQAWLSNRPTTSKPEHTTGRKERVYQDDIQSNKGNIMTLDVDIRDIKNRDTVCFNKEETTDSVGRRLVGLPYSDVTNYLIIGCAGSIGIPNIDERNYRNVFARHQFLQKDMVTLEQVKAHIGLKVNGSFEQLTSWRNRIARSKWCEIVYEIDKIK